MKQVDKTGNYIVHYPCQHSGQVVMTMAGLNQNVVFDQFLKKALYEGDKILPCPNCGMEASASPAQ